MTEDDRERYVRWQDYRITHFSFSINLFLVLAAAALGFAISLLKDSTFIPKAGTGQALYRSVLSLACSIVFGSFATLCRLADFRFTVIKIGKKYSDWRQSLAEFLAKYLGGLTWSFFYLQLAALAYGAFRLITAILIIYSDKLSR